MASSTGLENSGNTDLSNDEEDAIFDLCRRTAIQAQKLKAAGDFERSNGLLQNLLSCQNRSREVCPRHSACLRYFSRLKIDTKETASALVDWETLVRRPSGHLNINGNEVRHGFEDLYVARDYWHNQIWHQKLSMDLAFRYENSDALKLLQIWQSKPQPRLEDFLNQNFETKNLLANCHVFEFVDSNTTRFIRYAPNMIALSGRDHTNDFVQDFALRGFSGLLQRVQNDMVDNQAPHYGYVARRMNLKKGRNSASMRRLELPYFDGAKVAGSIAYILPD